MPRLPFAANAYVEESYGLPQIVLENWYAEETGDRKDWPYRLIPTPGLVAFSTGSTKGRGCFQSDAIASGPIFVVYGTAVKRVNGSGVETSITGAVTDDDKPIAFALSQTQAVINSGPDVYTATAANITVFTANLVAAGASGGIIDVAVLNNRHLYAEDNSGRIFYSSAGAATTISGFFTAERDPDQIKAILVVGSNILALGSRKTEFWSGTNSSTEPFIQRQGYVFEYGVLGSRARVQIGGAGYWVAHDYTVRRWSGGGAERISTHWLERVIAALTEADKALVRLTAHNWIGHQFVKLFIPGKGSYFYDALTGAWHRRRDRKSPISEIWNYDYFVESFGFQYVQELTTGRLFKLDAMAFVENGQLVRRVASVLAPVEKTVAIWNLIIEGQAGIGLDAVATQGSDPECMVKVAYDGEEFGSEMIRKIGKHGERRWRPVFGPVGTLKPPIAKLELAYSDPVGWSVYGVTYNEEAR